MCRRSLLTDLDELIHTIALPSAGSFHWSKSLLHRRRYFGRQLCTGSKGKEQEPRAYREVFISTGDDRGWRVTMLCFVLERFPSSDESCRVRSGLHLAIPHDAL